MENEDIARIIRKMLLLRGAGASIAATDVARAIVGKDAKKWRHLMKPVRETAIGMAKDGEIVLKRKGKVVAEPDKLKGVYRIALAPPPRVESGQPETGQPETDQPESGQPEFGLPESGQPTDRPQYEPPAEPDETLLQPGGIGQDSDDGR